MDLGIAGRQALVMGASRGLGRACAAALAQEGVAVTLVARDLERVARAAA
jgi:3-oxoacyl-[acyl-carrier protein] reductase